MSETRRGDRRGLVQPAGPAGSFGWGESAGGSTVSHGLRGSAASIPSNSPESRALPVTQRAALTGQAPQPQQVTLIGRLGRPDPLVVVEVRDLLGRHP